MQVALAKLKDGLSAFSGLAALAYACGYLAMRSRARALGTDPMLGLVDEAYVFAGFRFALVTMLALLVGLPLLLLIRRILAAMGSSKGSPGVLDWGLLALVAFGLLLQLVFALGVQGLLLHERASAGWLAGAALGTNGGGTLATLLFTIVSAGLVIWCLRVLGHPTASTFASVLMLVTTMQLLLLPVLHGLFFADRVVRVIEPPPIVAAGTVGPVAIVERSSSRATLLACSPSGKRRLVSVEFKALDGAPVVAIEPLQAFLGRLPCKAVQVAILARSARSIELLLGGLRDPVILATKRSKKPAKSNEAPAQPFWVTVVDYLKIGFENISSLGESGVAQGVVKVVNLSENTRTTRVIGTAAGLSWPVVAEDGTVYALQGRQAMRFGPGSNTGEALGLPRDWIKLLGVGADGSLIGLVSGGTIGRPAVQRRTGEFVVQPEVQSAEERKRIALLTQESRRFADGYELRVDRVGRGFDIFVRNPRGGVENISNCAGARCGQPSLSTDRKMLAFVESR